MRRLFSLTILLLMQIAFGQDVRLQQFIDDALTANRQLEAARQNARAQTFLPDRESALPDPVLGYTQWIQSVETRVGPQFNVISLSQKIPFPGKLGIKEKIFEKAAEEADMLYQSQRLDLVLNVKNNWYDLFLVDKSLEIYHEYYDLLKDFVDAAAVKYATGEGIQAAVLKAQVEHASIQARIKELNRRRSNLQSALNRLRNQQGDISPVTAIDSSGFAVTLQEAQTQALADRPEVAAIRSRKQKIGLENELAGKNYWPDFTLQATYISVEDKNTMATDAGKDAWGVMLGLNIPLWQAPRNAETERTYAAQNAEEARLQDLQIQIRENINDLMFRQTSTYETIELYKNELLPQAENSLASALAAYRSGRIGFLELLDAERMLLQLRLSFINEQVNYQKTVAALERAVGKTYE